MRDHYAAGRQSPLRIALLVVASLVLPLAMVTPYSAASTDGAPWTPADGPCIVGGCEQWVATHNGPAAWQDISYATAVSPDGAKVFLVGTVHVHANASCNCAPQPAFMDGAVVAFDASSQGEAWKYYYNGTGGALDRLDDVVVSPDSASVYAIGSTVNAAGNSDVLVLALRASDGVPRWVRTFDGAGRLDSGRRVSLTPDGSKVIVAADTQDSAGTFDAAVLAYAAANGAPAWTHRWETNLPSWDDASTKDLAVSPDGTRVAVVSDTAGVRLLSVTTGAASWTYAQYNGGRPWTQNPYPYALEFLPDSSGLVVAGYADNPAIPAWDPDFIALALATATGAVRWASNAGPAADNAQGLVISPDGGTVFLAGATDNATAAPDVLVAAFATSDGTVRWAAVWDGANHNGDTFYDIAVHPGGGLVYVAGSSYVSSTDPDAFVAAYGASTGTKAWEAARAGPGWNGAGYGDWYADLAVSPSGDALYAGGTTCCTNRTFDFLLVSYVARTEPPSVPTGVAAARGPGAGAITVAWQPPVVSAVPVTSYAVYRGTSATTLGLLATVDASARTFTDSGLGAGTTWHYAVTASSSAGEGPRSSVVSATTHPMPGAPSSTTAVAGPAVGEVRVTWSAPSDTGGLPLTGFGIYRSQAGGAFERAATLGPSDRAWTDVGRPPATDERYRVAAATDAGEGDPGPLAAATTYGVPSAPRALATTRGPAPGEISLSWQPAAFPNATSLYRILRGDADGPRFEIGASTGPSFVDTGLSAGASVVYEVRAENAVGLGPPSATATGTAPVVPGPPTALVGSAGSSPGVASVRWSPPATNGGTALVGYAVYGAVGAGSPALLAQVGASTTSYSWGGHADGASVKFWVAAQNGVGEGPTAGPITATTATLPGSPRNVDASPGAAPRSVQVTWLPPLSTGGVPVVQYEIQRSEDGFQWTVVGTTAGTIRIFTDTGLTPLKGYSYRVSARNIVGQGPLSGESCSNPSPWVETVATMCVRVVP